MRQNVFAGEFIRADLAGRAAERERLKMNVQSRGFFFSKKKKKENFLFILWRLNSEAPKVSLKNC